MLSAILIEECFHNIMLFLQILFNIFGCQSTARGEKQDTFRAEEEDSRTVEGEGREGKGSLIFAAPLTVLLNF